MCELFIRKVLKWPFTASKSAVLSSVMCTNAFDYSDTRAMRVGIKEVMENRSSSVPENWLYCIFIDSLWSSTKWYNAVMRWFTTWIMLAILASEWVHWLYAVDDARRMSYKAFCSLAMSSVVAVPATVLSALPINGNHDRICLVRGLETRLTGTKRSMSVNTSQSISDRFCCIALTRAT